MRAALLDLSPRYPGHLPLPRPLSLLLRVVLSHSPADGCSGSFQGPGWGDRMRYVRWEYASSATRLSVWRQGSR